MPESVRKKEILGVISQTLVDNCGKCNYRCPVLLFNARRKTEKDITFDIGEGQKFNCCANSEDGKLYLIQERLMKLFPDLNEDEGNFIEEISRRLCGLSTT